MCQPVVFLPPLWFYLDRICACLLSIHGMHACNMNAKHAFRTVFLTALTAGHPADAGRRQALRGGLPWLQLSLLGCLLYLVLQDIPPFLVLLPGWLATTCLFTLTMQYISLPHFMLPSAVRHPTNPGRRQALCFGVPWPHLTIAAGLSLTRLHLAVCCAAGHPANAGGRQALCVAFPGHTLTLLWCCP